MNGTLYTVSHLGLKNKLQCFVVGRENLLRWAVCRCYQWQRIYIFLKVHLK